MGLRLRGANAVLAALGALTLLVASEGVHAQQPSPAQVSAIRSNCRSDFMANCSGVTPGGAEALECLKRNASKLSGACKSAVNAISLPPAAAEPAPSATAPAPAMAPPPPAAAKPAAPPLKPAAAAPAAAPGFPLLGPPRPMLPRRALMIVAVCRADAQTLCAGVDPGGERILSCLAAHGPQLSPECYKELAPVTR